VPSHHTALCSVAGVAEALAVLDRLEADFRLVDEAHARGNAAALAWRLAEQWSMGLVDWPEEAAALKQLLRREQVGSHELHAAAPHLDRALNPVWLASPYEMPRISPVMPFDAVILVVGANIGTPPLPRTM